LISLYNLLGIIAWREENNKTKSVELARKTLALDENNYDSHLRLALYEYQEGNIPESKRHVKRCKHISPRHPCTIFDQAFYFILERKYSNAAIAYKKLNQATVDGLIAFEVANFLEEEYFKKKKEIGFLFASGFVNTKFVPHAKLGLKQLKEFYKLAEGRKEYIDFYYLAKGTISNYRE
jgi:tetratricopeptide (TPR) repeat protein